MLPWRNGRPRKPETQRRQGGGGGGGGGGARPCGRDDIQAEGAPAESGRRSTRKQRFTDEELERLIRGAQGRDASQRADYRRGRRASEVRADVCGQGRGRSATRAVGNGFLSPIRSAVVRMPGIFCTVGLSTYREGPVGGP